LKKRVELLPGDIKRVALKLKEKRKKFDVIVMPRPQLKETFLHEAFSLSKNGTRIYYYDFCKEDEINSIVEKVKAEAKKARKKIKILKVKKAGEIAPYRYRIRIDFRVL
jgi:tRNA (guanine37-N1)-methyltransferase